ncbi:hypothetical protein [Thioclava sp. GXIMD2076]|uniref:Lipoprotein n=1 Tax=Thioclava kandeliae TaxID=3070818 RepID=A0ABV1SI28_9RHOB
MMIYMRLALSLSIAGLLAACEPQYAARDVLRECQTLYLENDRFTDANLASEAMNGYRGPHVPSMHAMLIPQKSYKPRKVEQCDEILVLERRLPGR